MSLDELKNKYDLTGVELYELETSNQSISFEANNLKQTEVDFRKGKSLRILKDNKISYVSAYGEKDLDELAKEGCDLLEYSPEGNIDLPGNLIESDDDEAQFLNDPVAECKVRGEEIIETVLSQCKGEVLVDASFDVGTSIEKISNSSGLSYSLKDSSYSFSAFIKETTENDFFEVYAACVDRDFIDHKPYIDEIISFYHYSRKSAKAKNGKYPVLFTSKAVPELLKIINAALNGKMVNQKSSPWAGKIGEKVLSEKITIKQDPTFGYMSRKLDDEGVKIQDVEFVKNGVLNSFYYDLLNAKKAEGEVLSTGAGFRPSLGSKVDPSPLNFMVEPGDKSFAEIVSGLDYGIIVDQTMGSLVANISGDMSFNVELGFLVENGEVIGRVKDTMVSGNVYTALSNVIELSNAPKWHWSSYYRPDILMDSFNIVS